MSDKEYSQDTIVALSTPPGIGGIAVIRLSGPAALDIVSAIFKPRGGACPSAWKTHTVHFGYIVERQGQGDQKTDAVIDEVLVTVMRSPRSYTGEDTMEISCHAGLACVRAVLAVCLKAGARLAEPGEYTKRAFLNGRMDLAQAEAVQDIIQATTASFLKVSVHQLKGELTRELEAIRADLMNVYAHLEAAVNFPDEELDTANRRQLEAGLAAARKKIRDLQETGRQGRLLKEGVRVAICGKPNVGKSSLLNVLLREPRAIVTAVAGTTRDTIEEVVPVEGIPCRLVDTAGILEPRDVVEQEAVRRSREAIDAADLILFMLDADRGVTPEDKRLVDDVRDKNIFVVVNKCDLSPDVSLEPFRQLMPGRETFQISALKGNGVDELRKGLARVCLRGRAVDTDRVLVNNLRHLEALGHGLDFLERADRSLREGLSLEFISDDVKRAVRELDRITGRQADQDLLDRIFAAFCVGK